MHQQSNTLPNQTGAYSSSFSPPVAQQVISAMNEIMYGGGMERIRRLARNSRYFRRRLQQLGCIVYGHDDSPIVPLMPFLLQKTLLFTRE